jgi:hypothetical protein
MLGELIAQCPDELWDQAEEWESPAWQQVLHVLMGMEYWMQLSGAEYRPPDFGKPINVNLGEPSENSLSKQETQEYFNKVLAIVNAFFEQMDDQKIMGVSLISEEWSNLDIVIEMIRHNQHHIGQLNNALKNKGMLPVEYKYYNM